MARIPLVTRDQIVEKEKPAYDAFMLSRANRPNIGPYSLILHMPEVAQKVEALRIYLRDEASLSQRLQELVMISVAREMSCAFIWGVGPSVEEPGINLIRSFAYSGPLEDLRLKRP